MVIFNGLGVRLKRNDHYHIIPIKNHFEKTMIYASLRIPLKLNTDSGGR